MTTLYLHIGTHKTGSTAIQRALLQARAALESEGVRYLPELVPARAIMNATAVDEHLVSDARTALLEQCAGTSPPRSVVVSYEGFCGSGYDGYQNAGQVAETLRAASQGFDTKVIVYVRRQDHFIESLYTQSIHEGRSWTFGEFCARLRPEWFDWNVLIDHYSQRFGSDNVIVRVYDKRTLPETSSLVVEFAGLIDAPALAAFRATEANTGYSRQALEFARACNGRLREEERIALRGLLQRSNSRHPFESYGYYDSSSRAEVLRRYSAANALLAKRVLGSVSSELFSPLSETDGATVSESHFAPEDAYVVLVRMLLAANPNATQPASLSTILRRRLRAVSKPAGAVRRFARLLTSQVKSRALRT